MSSNGIFRKKKGFTIVENTVTRDQRLSLKAKGLYALIASYITLESLVLNKTFLLGKCQEGKKAFESAWTELKKSGYLKVYMQPCSKQGWNVEYELLDEPKKGAHTFYLTKEGKICRTNLSEDKENVKEEMDKDVNLPLPQKGGNAQALPQKGSNDEGIYDNRGDIYNTNNKTSDNTYINTSFNPLNDKKTDQGSNSLNDGMNDELDENPVPISCSYDRDKLFAYLKDLTDYEAKTTYSEYKEDRESFVLLVDCLIEMITEKQIRTYRGQDVRSFEVLRKLNDVIKRDDMQNLSLFTYQTIENFNRGIEYSEVQDYKAYMKACIWDSFTTFKVRFDAEFKKKFYFKKSDESASL